MRITMSLTKNLFFLFAFSFAFTAFAAENTPDTIDGTKKVTASEVVDLVGSLENLVIIDARKPADRAAGYIEGSVGLVNTETTPESLAKLVATKETPILFYCNGEKCGRSVESAKNAVAWGYKEIYWFRGGWDEWSSEGLPVTTD